MVEELPDIQKKLLSKKILRGSLSRLELIRLVRIESLVSLFLDQHAFIVAAWPLRGEQSLEAVEARVTIPLERFIPTLHRGFFQAKPLFGLLEKRFKVLCQHDGFEEPPPPETARQDKCDRDPISLKCECARRSRVR